MNKLTTFKQSRESHHPLKILAGNVSNFTMEAAVQQIAALYEGLLAAKGNDEIRAVTEQLLAIFKDPVAVPAILTIVGQHPNMSVRQAAATGLKLALKATWKFIYYGGEDKGRANVEQINMVRTMILEVLPAQQVSLAKQVIDYCDAVFETETQQWPELLEFIGKLTDTPDHIIIGNYLVCEIAQYLGEEKLAPLGQQLIAFAQSAIALGTAEAVKTGCLSLGVVISFMPPEVVGMCRDSFMNLLGLFQNALTSSDNDMSCELAKNVGDVCQATAPPIPVTDVLTFLCGLLKNPQVEKDMHIHVFTALNELVEYHGEEMEPALEQLVQLLIEVVAELNNGELCEDNGDAWYVASTAELMASQLSDTGLFKVLKRICAAANENPNTRFAYLLVFFNCLGECKEAVLENMKFVCEYLFGCLKDPSPQVRHVALSFAGELSEFFEDDQVELATQLVQCIIGGFQSEDASLIFATLNALVTVLNETTVSSSIIQPVLDILLQVVSRPEMQPVHALAVEAIASLVFAVEEDIAPYAHNIFPIVLEAARAPELQAPFLKQQAVTALGMLLRFAPQQLESVFNDSVALIFSVAETEDTDLRNSVMMAIGNLIIAKTPLLVTYKDAIGQLISTYFQTDLFSAEIEDPDEDGMIAKPSSLTGFTNILRLIKWIFKGYPELLPENHDAWIEIPISFMMVDFVELQSEAIGACLYSSLFRKDANVFCGNMLELFNRPADPVILCKCFRSFKIIVEQEIAIEPGFLEGAVKAALAAMDGKLVCRREGEMKASSAKYVYEFLGVVFLKFPKVCPLAALIDHGNKLLKNDERYFEVSQYVSLLEKCFVNAGELGSLSKNKLVEKFIQSFQKYTQVFDEDEGGTPFGVYPSPISGLRTVLEREPGNQALHRIIGDVMQFLVNVLNSPYQGETFYYATITNAVAFMCQVIKAAPDNFDYPNLFPLMIRRLPLKSEKRENEKFGELIYSTILAIIANHGTFGQDQDVLSACVRTLGLKDRLFNALELSQGTCEQLIGMSRQMVASAGEAAVRALFEDEQSFQRFMVRMR